MSGLQDAGLHRAGTGGSRSKGLLKEKLELERVKTKDGRTRVTLKPIDDPLPFDKGFYVFIRALQLLRSHNDGVVLVGLGGASGSGKTAFSERVRSFMPGITLISMDNYNDASKLVDGNFDDPRLTDYDLLMANLADLRAGRPADVPVYDFKQSARVGFNTLPVPQSRVVIIEGIYALSERLRTLLDLRVSITGGVHFDLVKRVLRDISRSGQGPEEIIQQITDTVFPMYKAFIEPDLQTAQLKISNSFNPFSGFLNATHILKARRPPGLTHEAALAALGAGASAVTEAETTDIHLLPPAEDPETCASWLRMRSRDGRYTLMFEEWVTEGDFIISPRIQFEVSVRVLGGLMALGYGVGTVMRRTSTLLRPAAADVTVKLDDVEQLGAFVQVQGKDRERVAAVARALGLGEFVPRSYIEQVQLAKLTQEFSAFTDDVKRRFSISGNSPAGGGSLLDDGLLAGGGLGGMSRGGPGRPLSSRFGGGRGHGGGGGAAGGGGDGGDDDDDALLLLSSSAPVRGSTPIAIAAGAGRKHGGSGVSGSIGGGVGSPCSSAAAAAGSTVGCRSVTSDGSSDEGGSPAGSLRSEGGGGAAGSRSGGGGGSTGAPRGGGLLGQQLRRSANGSSSSLQGADGHAAGAGSSMHGSGSGADAGQVPPLPPAQQQQPRQSAGGELAAAPAAAAAAASFGGASGSGDGGAAVQVLRRLQDQMEVVAEGFRRHSGMQLHLDALTHQYKQLNGHMADLAAATQALQACVTQLQAPAAVPGSAPAAAAAAAPAQGLAAWLPPPGNGSSSLLLLGAGAVAGAAAAALLLRGSSGAR